MIDLPSADTVALISAIAAVVSAATASFAIWYQGRLSRETLRTQSEQTRLVLGVDILLRLLDRFDSNEFRRLRVSASRGLQSAGASLPEKQAMWDVLDFLESVGHFFAIGVLDLDSVWQMFSFWVLHYYEAASDQIDSVQKSDRSRYINLARLKKHMDAYVKKHSLEEATIGGVDRQGFLRSEMALVVP